MLRRLVVQAAIASLCIAGSWEPSALAEGSLADKAAAQTLFDEGRKLMADGKFAEACPKLGESQRLDPGVGTQFHLADCYERIGQTASAWAGFLEAASGAKALGQTEREKVARERAAALAPRLSKLTIVAARAADVPGLEIKRDGSAVGRPLWGTAVPVDPGSHTIEAVAPGKKPWRSTVQLAGEHASIVVSVPAFDDAPPAERSNAATVAAPGGGEAASSVPARRTVALIVGGVGVVGLGIGTVFAIQAKSKYDDSLAHCTEEDKNKCFDEGVRLRGEARSAGNVATVAMGIGGAALIAGAVLFFTAPASTDKPRALVVPTVAPGTAGLFVSGWY